MNEKNVRVRGSLFRAFLSAGESLRLLLRGNVEHLESYDANTWYEWDELNTLIGLTRRYRSSARILEQLGMEMMRIWYAQGAGRESIASGLDFLKLQEGSTGYASVVSGPPELIGEFALESLDEQAGVARIYSTTIFPRELERGILLGGLGLVGDLLYFTVDNGRDPDRFEILFVTPDNRPRFRGQSVRAQNDLEWRFRHHLNMTEERAQFWACINDTLNAAYSEIATLATLDPLTSVYNRRELYRLADIELAKSRRSNCAASLLYLDLDHFKSVNDSYGHDAGDRALAAFAGVCRAVCRQFDLIGRLGGEEFCILLPLTDMEAAVETAARILSETRNLRVDLPGASIRFTVSIGVALYNGAEGLSDLILRADRGLLRAKQLGRNRIFRSD